MADNVSVQAHQIKRSDLQYIRKIGEGGYSTVYEMLWKTNGNKQVAVKKLNKLDEREVDVLLKLEHNNIVQLLGVVDEEMDYMLVLEYCQGGSLRSYLNEHIDQPLSQQLFYDWLEQAAKPVQYLNKVHIIHKDIKSGNYLITQANTLKLADFGLAKKSKQGYTVSNVSGSASYAYMAPELAIENKLSPSYDIFSLAVVIWELFTRQVPFKGKENMNIMYIVCNNDERPPIPSDCPEILANLMRQCWYKERQNRPSIEQVMETIKEARSLAFFMNDDDQQLQEPTLANTMLYDKDVVQEVPELAVTPVTAPSKADEAVKDQINQVCIRPENGVASQPSSLPNMPVWNEEPSNVALNGDNVPEMNRYKLAAVEGEVSKVLAADMPLLPHLKLVIIGSKSDQFAESLLSGDISPKSEDAVCKMYKTCLMKKEQVCEWSPSHGKKTIQPIMKAVTNAVRDSLGIDLTTSTLSASHASEQCELILNHIGQNGFTSESNTEEVELEVLAVKDSPLSTYCRHVLYTAHSIYMVQFDISEYYENRDSVLIFIQTELSKIHTYASDKVQIMLVATASNSRDMNHIGQTLQEYFRGAFANQLHPNPENNLPCHFVFPGNLVNGLSSQLNDLSCFDRQESCEDNTAPQHTTNSVPNGDSHMDYVPHRMRAGHINGEDQSQSDADGLEKHYNVYDLKSQISTMAFQQRFAPRKYPYRYLLYQDQKENVRYSHPVGALKSDILRECHIEDEAEKNAVLKYLHDSGDIICMNNLPYMMSHNLHLLNFMDMVLFSRDHLIDAIQKLLTIPPLPSQLPAHRMHWAELENTAQIRRSFLLDLLGADHRLLEIFLEMMNLIFCMDDGLTNQQRNVKGEYVPHRRCGDEDNAAEIQNGTASAQYLVPFYLAKQHRNVEDSAPRRSNGDRILYLDFRGFIPHGAFTRVMIQLIGVSEQERGSWENGSQCSGWVTFGKHAKDFDCRLEMQLDPLGATIKISALCSMSYSPQNIPTLLQQAMKRLKPKDNIIAYKCGPPCPRIPHCQHGQTRVHVLDLRDGWGPLWCGQEPMDREQSVNQWLLEEAVVPDLPPTDDSTEVTVVRRSSHIRHLPPSLYTWICNQLNVGYATGQNWEMLADELGYQMSDILVWRERRQRVTDPCDSFLQDWGRHQSATLDKLIQCLNHMRRKDMLEDMRYQWNIVN